MERHFRWLTGRLDAGPPPTHSCDVPSGAVMLDVNESSLSRRGFVGTVAGALALPLVYRPESFSQAPQTALHYMSVTALAAAIRQKKVSSVEALEACIKRIGEVNPRINALVQPAFDAA